MLRTIGSLRCEQSQNFTTSHLPGIESILIYSVMELFQSIIIIRIFDSLLCHRSAVSRFPLRHLSSTPFYTGAVRPLSISRQKLPIHVLLVEFFSTTIDAFSSPPWRELRARRNRSFPALLVSCSVIVRRLAILQPSFGRCETSMRTARSC